MHYIRTKDLVFAASYIEDNYIYTINGEIGCKPHEVVAESDNLNELCDAFVVVDGNQVAELHNFKLAKNTKGEVYGVIYVVDEVGSEETKTVAKMNDKGELELL